MSFLNDHPLLRAPGVGVVGSQPPLRGLAVERKGLIAFVELAQVDGETGR